MQALPCVGQNSRRRPTIKKTELAIKQAEATLQTKQSGIVEQLTPKLAGTINYAVRQQAKTVKYKTIAAWRAAVLAISLVPSMFTYAAGLIAGRFQGEVASQLISVAIKAGPAEAIAWGQLMQDNNGASAMAVCRRNLQQDADGRHYCMLPVWTDPIPSTVPSNSQQ